MQGVFVTQLLLKQGAAIKSRKQSDSTSYSGAFEVRLYVLFCFLAVLNPPMSMPISDEQEL